MSDGPAPWLSGKARQEVLKYEMSSVLRWTHKKYYSISVTESFWPEQMHQIPVPGSQASLVTVPVPPWGLVSAWPCTPMCSSRHQLEDGNILCLRFPFWEWPPYYSLSHSKSYWLLITKVPQHSFSGSSLRTVKYLAVCQPLAWDGIWVGECNHITPYSTAVLPQLSPAH